MGEIIAWGGPLPAGWIDGQLRLYQMVLRRMRDLGMRPVLPAFAGFVPPAITRFASSTRVTILAFRHLNIKHCKN